MIDLIKCYVINSVCCLLYKKESRRFQKSGDIKVVQQEKLFSILTKNAQSEYGRQYDFAGITTAEAFQKQVPITTYEDYKPYIDKIARGEKKVLTIEDVLLFELTSGSVSATKLIPYTQGLKDEFQKAIKPWIYDIYTNYKGVKWGRSYWSVTPATSVRQSTECGIPIGFEEDTEYFGKLEKRLFDQVFAVPGTVSQLTDMEEFYFQTSLGLLKCDNLTLISVWNPTFFILILQFMRDHRSALCQKLKGPSKKRRLEIEAILADENYALLWKKLRVISCWCDANAYQHSEALRRLFPSVEIQAKGLLATEGFMSFPLANEAGARLAVNSHYYEFEDLNTGDIHLAHELGTNKQYSVIITTSGGFYRYRMNDLVRVVGTIDGFPLLRFIGKGDRVSDLFGEKLNEVFVMNAVGALLGEQTFYMVAPEVDHYVLFTGEEVSAQGIDQALRTNFHYDYCRKLGQLKALRVFKLSGNSEKEYMEACTRAGIKLGDIKQTRLSMVGGWDRIFTGDYVESRSGL